MRANFLLGLILAGLTLGRKVTPPAQPTPKLVSRYPRHELPPGVHHIPIDRTRHLRHRFLSATDFKKEAIRDRARTISKYHQSWVVWNDNKMNGIAEFEGVKKRSNYESPTDIARYNIEKRANQVITASLAQDIYSGVALSYFGGVLIGTPAQQFPIEFDTYSSNFWIPGPEAATDLPKFRPELSSTFKSRNSPVNVSEDIWGILGTDTVSFGSLKSVEQAFIVTNSTPMMMAVTSFAGVLGMGFQSMAASKSPPFHIAVADQLASKVFSFHFAAIPNDVRQESESKYRAYTQTKQEFNVQRRSQVLSLGEPGELQQVSESSDSSNSGWTADKDPMMTAPGGSLLLGGIDSSLLVGEPVYQSLVSANQWAVELKDYTVDGEKVAGTGGRAIFDTGTTYVGLPKTKMAALASAIGAVGPDVTGMYDMPCARLAKLDLSLSFGGKSFPVRGILAVSGETAEADCTIGILGVDVPDLDGQNISVIGDVFLSQFYSIFDFGQSRIGLAELKSKAAESSNIPNAKSSTDSHSNDKDIRSSETSSVTSASGVVPSATKSNDVTPSATPISSSSTISVQHFKLKVLALGVLLTVALA